MKTSGYTSQLLNMTVASVESARGEAARQFTKFSTDTGIIFITFQFDNVKGMETK